MHRPPLPLMCLLALLSLTVAHAEGWAKYVAPDGSLSMHYPAGWAVAVDGSAVTFSNTGAHEDLQLSPIPNEGDLSARELAEQTVAAFRNADMPDLAVRQWRESQDPQSLASLQTTYTQGGRRFIGDMLVIKTEGGGLVLAYTAPEAGYNADRSTVLLQGLIQSLAEGEGSKAPDVAIPEPTGGQSDVTARAFLFVVEFAIGTPLPVTQEKVVLDQMKALLDGLPPAERARYDEYLKVMATILALKEDQVGPVRKSLEETVREQIETGADDPAINAIRDQLEKSKQVVAAGQPQLTELQATAFGEMLAYGQLLYTAPEARPEDVDPAAVAGWRQHLIEVWGDLAQADRDRLAALPGVWMVDRTVLTIGTPEEQLSLRKHLRETAPSPESAQVEPSGQTQPVDNDAQGGTPAPWHSDVGRELTHRYLSNQMFMQRLQQRSLTNSYVWGRAFNW